MPGIFSVALQAFDNTLNGAFGDFQLLTSHSCSPTAVPNQESFFLETANWEEALLSPKTGLLT